MSDFESALYQGQVYHQRLQPTQHQFAYNIYLFWIKLNEVKALDGSLKRFSYNSRNWVEFRRSDYFGNKRQPLDEAILKKMSSLHGHPLTGEVFMLGQLRMLGVYFSPVNFYFLRNTTGAFSHMLAEVSNTPWHEQHYYLVDLNIQADTPKAFHVSPFNPMDMLYKWEISVPSETFSLSMQCYQTQKDFTAGLSMKRISLHNKNLGIALRRIPSMTLKTMVGIYWQALKLFLKRTPVYDHP